MNYFATASVMLKLQSDANDVMKPDWLTNPPPFLRASFLECAEGIEHHGWKWWKKQDMDRPQLQMELIDILHFGLSHLLVQKAGDIDAAAKDMDYVISQYDLHNYGENSFQLIAASSGIKLHEDEDKPIVALLEAMAASNLAGNFDFTIFRRLLDMLDMTWTDVFTWYVSKNMLNLFRQSHGYKDGTYRKHWHDGREDNEHLSDIMDSLEIDQEDPMSAIDQIKAGLEERYAITA